MMQSFMRFTEKFCRLADTVIAVAPNIQKHLDTLGITSQLIRNGLEISDDITAPKDRKAGSVVAVGRVTMQKNYSVLIDAAHILAEQGDAPDITVLGGSDLTDEQEKLENKLRDLGDVKLNFAGLKTRSGVLQELDENALYVNCSIHEGMSNAVLEAIQKGIPVIVSDIESNRDLDLGDEFYFDPHNPQMLANKIKDALANPEKYIVDPKKFNDWDGTIDEILKVTGVIL